MVPFSKCQYWKIIESQAHAPFEARQDPIYTKQSSILLKMMASSVKRKKWNYCTGFGNKGKFLSSSKHLDKRKFFSCSFKFVKLFPMKVNALFYYCFEMLLYFLGSIFKKKFIKDLVCLIIAIIFCHIRLFPPSNLIFSIKKGYFEGYFFF